MAAPASGSAVGVGFVFYSNPNGSLWQAMQYRSSTAVHHDNHSCHAIPSFFCSRVHFVFFGIRIEHASHALSNCINGAWFAVDLVNRAAFGKPKWAGLTYIGWQWVRVGWWQLPRLSFGL
jgi:hypothetical protein